MAEENIKLLVSPSPHIKATTPELMRETILALLPASLFGIYLFGMRAVVPILFATLTAVISEAIMRRLRGRKTRLIDVLSAVLTGLLLALTLPPGLPWYATMTGAAVSIVIVKHLFGGLGYNIFNPALAGRAFIMAAWPVIMTAWIAPFPGIDAVTSATPLAMLKFNHVQTSLTAMFLGTRAGCIGETSSILLVLGGLYLLARKVIEWRIPFAYLSTVIIMSLIFKLDPAFQFMAGGLLLGAFFMATDLVTSPVTKPGRWVFGIGCGLITMVIRLYGGYPEGVCYSILIMNATVPLLDRYLRGRTYGT